MLRKDLDIVNNCSPGRRGKWTGSLEDNGPRAEEILRGARSSVKWHGFWECLELLPVIPEIYRQGHADLSVFAIPCVFHYVIVNDSGTCQVGLC